MELYSPLTPPPISGGTWNGLYGSSLSLALLKTAERHNGITLVVAHSPRQAQNLEYDLKLLAGEASLPILHFPDWETLPYDPFSPHPDIISERLRLLISLPGHGAGILVVPITTLLQRLSPVDYVTSHGLLLHRQQQLPAEQLQRQLSAAAYEHVEQVHQPGQFTVRGSLIDLFPMGAEKPVRVELFDDEIESLRTFDPETQRSLKQCEKISLLPAREYPFNEDTIPAFRRAFRNRFDIDTRRCPIYQDLRQGIHPQGLEYYLPMFFETTAGLLDYLSGDVQLILDAGITEAAQHFQNQLQQRYEQRRHDIDRPILPPDALFFSTAELADSLAKIRSDHFVHNQPAKMPGPCFNTQAPPDLFIHEKSASPGKSVQQFCTEFSGRILFVADSPGRRQALIDTLQPFGIRPQSVDSWNAFMATRQPLPCITVMPLEQGFVSGDPKLAVITEAQLFGGRLRQRRQRERSGRDPESIIRNLTDLSIGAPVVHEEYGVGRYQGLQVLDLDNGPTEFLNLEYAKGDKLYVPVASLHLISRYTGGSPESAPLHRLGGDQWEKVKRRAAEKIRDVAAELLELYARREARNGHAYSLDPKLYAEFAATFAFEETPDQLQTISAVTEDMLAEQPMDRVVCGDVGFGKTEVALRAAFIAVQAGRQVAVLVPTTLLAQQHYRTFSDRFADWPIHIEALSRFRSGKQTGNVLKGLADGRVDIVIGTHRLIQGDIDFKNLGLLIVDEEQRFGVRQKERLKALRSQVDILTLTATPIPRTLNMAMSGLRDLSIIATPPARRMAVKTFVSQWSNGLLKEAMQRELQRGGQVYFLHNEVQTIDKIARQLEEIIPSARIKIAHGQMHERELEQAMLDFHRQRFNVLVCTTIIENGIDIPSANTIIINRADKLGLSQLHQLRGRVGRSHHRAYAYLLIPDRRSITSDARKRLDAIASLEELGAGFTLATHDLEIRGAGELLGDEQSGQIQEIGFHLVYRITTTGD